MAEAYVGPLVDRMLTELALFWEMRESLVEGNPENLIVNDPRYSLRHHPEVVAKEYSAKQVYEIMASCEE